MTIYYQFIGKFVKVF